MNAMELKSQTHRPVAAQARPADMTPSPKMTPTHAGDPPDVSLVERWRGGDGNAGEALVGRYCQPLMRYLRRLSGSDHVAEELHQQTWLSVLEHLDKFDPNTNTGAGGFKAWLFRIATNKANDTWRSRGRERVAKEGLRLVTEYEGPDVAHGASGDEQGHKLLRAIDQLPEAQKQVLLLRYYSDMKFVEIAEMLGCPLNTALGRMHKAMLKLKQLMEEKGEG
jgi:RNA polymerase sigma-70 factor (ECF subfamily)